METRLGEYNEKIESQDRSYMGQEVNYQVNSGLREITPSVLTMDNPNIKKGFPFWERIGAACMACTKCCSADQKYVSRGYSSPLMITEAPAISEKMRGSLNDFYGKLLYMKIVDTGGLELDPNIIHPFVRVHIIDLSTNTYKIKSHRGGVIAYNEKIVQIDSKKTFYTGDSNFVLPFSTPPFDLRVKGENDPHWNEEFIINEDIIHLLEPTTIFLFEILDFNFKLIKQKSNLLTPEKFYPIAWGFLRPTGAWKMHLGESKIQLYRYKYKSPPNFSEPHRPKVFYDFNWYNKTKYPSFLRIELKSVYPDNIPIPIYLTSLDNERGQETWEELKRDPKDRKKKDGQDVNIEFQEKKKRLSKWKRVSVESSKLPNKFIKKFDASDLGCWRLSFSHSGRYLAAGCTDKKTVIKIFNIEDLELVMQIKGHADLIHDIVWSADDRYLLSCSTDGTSKLWYFGDLMDEDMEITNITSSNFNQGTPELLKYNMQHPSYVYSAVFHPQQSYDDVFFIATACFDGYVRLWNASNSDLVKMSEFPIISNKDSEYEMLSNTSNESKDMIMLGHRHPNCLVFGQEDILYIGDSLGSIYIYDIRIRNNLLQPQFIKQITLDEMTGDPINVINLRPGDDRMLLVQSRDNVIRGLEPSKGQDDHSLIYKRFFGSKCSRYNIRSCISPDGQFLVSGSEDGKVYVWDMATEILIKENQIEINVKDIISDVAWNPVYNMVAVAGFGSDLPIIIYAYEKSLQEIEEYYTKYPPIQHSERLVPNKEIVSDLAYEINRHYNY
jgi:jouberin